MDKVVAELGTAYFWMITVALALLINVVSAYLKYPIDKCMSSVSTRWKARSDKRKEQLYNLVAALDQANVREHIRWKAVSEAQRASHDQLRVVAYLVLSVAFFQLRGMSHHLLLPAGAMLAFAVMSLFSSMAHSGKTEMLSEALDTYEKNRDLLS